MNLTNYPVSRIKNLKITSSKIDYIVYFSLIALFFARFLNLPSTFLSLVGVYFFLAVPYVIGKSLCIFFENSIMKNFGFILTIFIETVFGMLFTVVLFALIQSISLSFIIIDAIPILVGICIAINISANFVKRQPHQIPQIHNDAFLKYFLLSVVASIGVVAVIKIFFLPLPNIGFNFDIPYTAYQTTERFVTNGYVELTWRWSEFILAGVPCNLLNLDPLYFIAAAPFALMVLFGSGLYLLSYHLLKRPSVAFIATVIGCFVNIGSFYNSIFINNPAYIYHSNTILSALFPFSLLVVLKVASHREISKLKHGILFLFLFVATVLLFIFFNTSWVHVDQLGLRTGYLGYVVFPIVTFAITAFSIFLCFKFAQRWCILTVAIFTELLLLFYLTHYAEAVLYGVFLSVLLLLFLLPMKFKKPLTIGVIYTTVLFSLLQITGIITRPLGLVIRTYTLADTYYITGFDMKWAAFFDTGHAYNEFLLIVFLALSVIFLIREKNEHIFNFLSLTWIALLIFFLPELFTYRNYQVLTPLLAITFAYLIDKFSTQKTLFKRPKND